LGSPAPAAPSCAAEAPPGAARADELDAFVRAPSAPGAVRGGFDGHRAFAADAHAGSRANELTVPALGRYRGRGGAVGDVSVERLRQPDAEKHRPVG
jgi:hypothetical protein